MILIQASDQNLIFGRQKFLALPFPADFYRKHVEEDEILEVLALLAEGSRIRTFTRAKGIKEDTVLRWLREAARHADKLAACVSPPPTYCAHCAAPTALRQGRDEHSPLTLLVSAGFHAQQVGSGERRLSLTRLFAYSFLWAFLMVAMSISNCR